MTTQDIEAFVLRGYNAYNTRQSDSGWLDYANEDVAEDCEVMVAQLGKKLLSALPSPGALCQEELALRQIW